MPFASQAPRPESLSPLIDGPMYGGTVSRWVESVTSGSSLDRARRQSLPLETGIRNTCQPSCTSKEAVVSMTPVSLPVVESMDMSDRAMSETECAGGVIGFGAKQAGNWGQTPISYGIGVRPRLFRNWSLTPIS